MENLEEKLEQNAINRGRIRAFIEVNKLAHETLEEDQSFDTFLDKFHKLIMSDK